MLYERLRTGGVKYAYAQEPEQRVGMGIQTDAPATSDKAALAPDDLGTPNQAAAAFLQELRQSKASEAAVAQALLAAMDQRGVDFLQSAALTVEKLAEERLSVQDTRPAYGAKPDAVAPPQPRSVAPPTLPLLIGREALCMAASPVRAGDYAVAFGPITGSGASALTENAATSAAILDAAGNSAASDPSVPVIEPRYKAASVIAVFEGVPLQGSGAYNHAVPIALGAQLPTHVLLCYGTPTSMCYAPDGTCVFAGLAEGALCVWDLAEAAWLHPHQYGTGPIAMPMDDADGKGAKGAKRGVRAPRDGGAVADATDMTSNTLQSVLGGRVILGPLAVESGLRAPSFTTLAPDREREQSILAGVTRQLEETGMVNIGSVLESEVSPIRSVFVATRSGSGVNASSALTGSSTLFRSGATLLAAAPPGGFPPPEDVSNAGGKGAKSAPTASASRSSGPSMAASGGAGGRAANRVYRFKMPPFGAGLGSLVGAKARALATNGASGISAVDSAANAIMSALEDASSSNNGETVQIATVNERGRVDLWVTMRLRLDGAAAASESSTSDGAATAEEDGDSAAASAVGSDLSHLALAGLISETELNRAVTSSVRLIHLGSLPALVRQYDDMAVAASMDPVRQAKKAKARAKAAADSKTDEDASTWGDDPLGLLSASPVSANAAVAFAADICPADPVLERVLVAGSDGLVYVAAEGAPPDSFSSAVSSAPTKYVSPAAVSAQMSAALRRAGEVTASSTLRSSKIPAVTIAYHPFLSSFFLVGYADGGVALFSLRYAHPMKSWSMPWGGMKRAAGGVPSANRQRALTPVFKVGWIPTRPSAFYAVDDQGWIGIFDLGVSFNAPIYLEQIAASSFAAPDSPASDAYLVSVCTVGGNDLSPNNVSLVLTYSSGLIASLPFEKAFALPRRQEDLRALECFLSLR
jgi:hypothetical protein